MTRALSVEIESEPSRGAGVGPGIARVHAEIDGRRALVASDLFFGTQNDYTGGVDYSYRVELHALEGAWFVREIRFEEIHYGPSSEETKVIAFDPRTGELRPLPNDAPEIAQLGDATLAEHVEG